MAYTVQTIQKEYISQSLHVHTDYLPSSLDLVFNICTLYVGWIYSKESDANNKVNKSMSVCSQEKCCSLYRKLTYVIVFDRE